MEHFEKSILSEPVQKRIFFGEKWTEEGFEITPRAEYKIAGRIMSIYPIKDALSISSLDLSIVWGPMTNEKVLSFFSWRHQGRILYYNFSAGASLDQEVIGSHLANMHTVPSNKNIRNQLEKISEGDEVFLKGKLIDVKNPSTGWHWETSLSRDDNGIALGASCELFWIEEVEILKKAPPPTLSPTPVPSAIQKGILNSTPSEENFFFEVTVPPKQNEEKKVTP